MIRIVHVITGLEIGGAESMLARLVSRMDGSRFVNRVVSLTDGGRIGDSIEAAGVPVQTLGMRRGWPSLAALPRLVRLLRQARPTLVQSWLYHADLLGLLAAALAGRPPVVWNLRCSDMDLRYYSGQTRWVLRALTWLSPHPVAILVNSTASMRLHQSLGYRPRRWEVIPNGFDLDRFRPDPTAWERTRRELTLPAEVMLVGLIARLDPMKDHPSFLNAATHVAARRPGVHFVLIGKGVEGLAGAIAAKGLSDRVHILGERRDVEWLLPGLDMVCLSSAFGEGFPNVLGEAMAAGVPCVTTDVGDAKTIVGETGLVVPPRDPAALAAAIVDLVDRGPSARTTLGQAARARIAREYALPRIVERYESIYASLAAVAS